MAIFNHSQNLTDFSIQFDIFPVILFYFDVDPGVVYKILHIVVVGKSIQFEVAVGMNGRVWVRARTVKETICLGIYFS